MSASDLEQYRNGTVDDLAGPRPKLVFVGINPGLWTVKTQTHFAHPSNRFYPALFEAGITPHLFDRVAGLNDADRAALTKQGIALTNLVARATAKASELSAQELRDGAVILQQKLAAWGHPVVAIAGISAYRGACGQLKATVGLQPQLLGKSRLWVVPNPSGLNAQVSKAELASWYAAAARDAGV